MERFYVQHHKLAQDITQVLRTEVKDLTQPTDVLKPQESPKTNYSINIILDQNAAHTLAQASVLSYNELREVIEAATSSMQLQAAWKQVEKNKELAGWQIKILNQLKENQRTKIDF